MKLSSQLKKYRKDRNRSLRAMERASGLSNPFLCQVEGADDDLWLGMSTLSLLRIVRAYELTFDEVLARLAKLAERKGLFKCRTKK